ncbi:transposase-like protein [Kitasatospora sp. GP82]|nr:transposase-like protein [Kitasatospora sp. GP82]
MNGNTPPVCPRTECGRAIEWGSERAGDGVRDWRCPSCGSFGYTLPFAYAARHPAEPVLQPVGRRAKVGR